MEEKPRSKSGQMWGMNIIDEGGLAIKRVVQGKNFVLYEDGALPGHGPQEVHVRARAISTRTEWGCRWNKEARRNCVHGPIFQQKSRVSANFTITKD